MSACSALSFVRNGAALLLVVVLAACGGGDGGSTAPPPPSQPAVSLSAPATATVSAGGTAATAITIARSGGFAGAVSLRTVGLPSGVTATFTPATLDAGVSSASIIWTAVASVAPGTHPVTVLAAGAGVSEVSASMQLAITPEAARASALEIVAGNAQRVSAGAPLPTAPRVRVLDQRGAPLAGVTVTFTVDSGAAQLADTVTVTGATGEATLGSWRPAPGRSVVRVTAQSLSPLHLHAFGEGALTVADSLLSNGGELTVRRPGDPLHGLTVSIPANAFGSPVRLRAQYGDAVAPALRAGVRLAAPVITLTVESASAAGLAPVRLRIPARVAAREAPIVMLIDPRTGATEVLPTIRHDSLFVIALAPSLAPPAGGGQAARVMSRAGIPTMSSATEVSTAVQVVIGVVNYEELTRDLTTGYRPEVDDWETEPLVMYRPDRRFDNGLPIAAAWYFGHYRARRGPLRNQFVKAPGIYYSNMLAARLGGKIWAQLDAAAIDDYNTALDALASLVTGLTVDSLILLKVKSGLFLTGRPQLLVGRESAASEARTFLLAYGASGNNLQISLGVSSPGPNAPRLLTLTNGRFGSFAWQPRAADDSRAPVTVEYIYSMGETAGIAAATLNRLWDETIAGTLRKDDLLETMLVTHEQRDIRDTLFIPGDTTRLWIECAACGEGFPVGPGFTPVHAVHGGRVARFREGSWVDLSVNGSVRGNGVRIGDTWDGQRLGIGTFERSGRFVDWLDVAVKVLRLTVTTETPTTAPGTDLTLTARFDRKLPPEPSWHWELGDGRTFVTTTGELTTRFAMPPEPLPHDYPVTVTLHSGTKRHARGEGTVRLDTDRLAWRLTSFAITGGDPLGDGGLGSIVPEAAHEWVLFVFLEPSAESGGASVPGAYLQRILPGQPVVFSRTDPSVIALANRERDAQRNVAGVFTWTGTGSSGSIEGSGSPGRFSCGPFPFEGTRQFFRTIRANKTGATLGGVMSSRIDRTSGCAGGASLDMMTANFVARRVP